MSAPLRILIADDHESFRAMLKSLLETLGAEMVALKEQAQMELMEEVTEEA